MILLALPLALPWFMAVIAAFLDGRKRPAQWLACLGLGAALIASVNLTYYVYTQGPVEMTAGGWAKGDGITLRADALGVLFMTLADLILLIALLYETLGGVEERPFPALVLFLAAGLSGLFLTADIFNFYVFFEVSMTASFILASYGQQAREVRDAFYFTIVNLLGSVLFLTAIAGLYHITGSLDMQEVGRWVDTVQPRSVILLATLVFVAFSIKIGLFPFHFWLPPVYRGTRPVIAAILSGALANIGSYGLLRFGGSLLYRELQLGATAIIVLGSASVVYGSLLAISRPSTRDVLAYSSISQAGFIMIGLGIGGPAGYSAAIIYAVVNAINKTLLFLGAGLKGWAAPIVFAIGAFSVAGVPPAAGFIGKAAILRAGLELRSPEIVTLVFLGSALSFLYMFQVYQSRYWIRAPRTERIANPSSNGRQALIFFVALLVISLGVFPEPLLWAGQKAAAVLQGGVP